MRVLAIGGAGGMGRCACRIAAAIPAVDELIITDLSAARARDAAKEFDGATAQALDLTDLKQLRAALARADVVLNAAGPFFLFGTTVLEAAIDARCDYIDICDDWEPTIELLGLDERAREAGVTAVIGMGASPGVSNLLAALAASHLDEVESVVTGWNVEGAQPEQSTANGVNAAIVHGIRQMTGKVRVIREFAQVDERPLMPHVIDYPGVGRRTTYSFGHPEPVTLAATLNLRESLNVTFGSRSFTILMRALSVLVDRGVLGFDRAARVAQWLEKSVPARSPEKTLFATTGLPPIFALATGKRDGARASVGAAVLGFPGVTMGAVTGVPMGVCLELMLRGELSRSGVFAPEACIDPTSFFAALAPHCIGKPSPDEMVLLTRSWDEHNEERYRAAADRARRRVFGD